jgi:cobaltochelatase CobS
MSFGKKTRLPADIGQLDFSKLQNFQLHALADYVGVLRAMRRQNTALARQQFLKEACLNNLEKAQEGYEIVVLGKPKATPGAVAPDIEKRAFEIVTEVVQSNREAMGEEAFKAVSGAVDAITGNLRKMVKEAINDAAEKVAPVVIKQGAHRRTVKGVLPPEFKRMVQLAAARVPVLLVGPAGCGKTYLCEKLGEALDLPVSDQSCSEGMSESVFNGLLLPIGKGGNFEHVASPFMERYEKGGVMLLDEMDAGDPNLFTYINKAIANRSYTVAQRWKKPVVKKHEDFVLVAAANTFGHGADAMYVGRNQLDAATLDRFKVGLITMDYSKEVEQSLAPQDLCEWAWRIRASIRSNKLRRVMSTRVIRDLATMTERDGWKQPEWEQVYFSDWSEADKRSVLQ